MEGHAFSMGTSGDFSAPGHGLEGSISISSEMSSSRRDHGAGAEGTARAQKKRKVRTPWSEENTPQLLRAYRKRKDGNGRCIMREVDWQSISEGMTGKDCQRRMDTLTKSFKKIKKRCAASHKKFSQLTEGEKRSLKLATKMEPNWYDQLCKIKEPPKKAMRVSHPDSGDQIISSSQAPASVMAEAGPLDHIIGEMVGAREPAWVARDPPRSTSPTILQSHSGAEPKLPPLADSPSHSHQHLNRVEHCIATAPDAAEPPHHPLVDLRNDRTATVDAACVQSQTDICRPQGLGFNDQSPQHPSHQDVQDTGHDSDELTTNHFDYTFPDVEGPSDFEQFLCVFLTRNNEDLCLDSDAQRKDCF